ncbi:sensor histidine kinase [Embleya hyalina]|uniref:sensor histidine kinase n=1 Tax=Embleya hyalina TaxID=516124 RepID=UPI001C3F95A6|nr:histidine kinase [Embleya hyalina]
MRDRAKSLWCEVWRDLVCLRTPNRGPVVAARTARVSPSRADVLDAHGAELRRIERDLHDGAQAGLVAVAMRLGVARDLLGAQHPVVAELLREALEGAEEVMTELRDVVRAGYPPILADRGLAGAVDAVAARTGVTTDVRLGELGRLPAAVEAAAYFVVAETLANTTKYSRARRARVGLTRRDGTLVVEVADDGVGGADERNGTGIVGIRRRVAALDGRVAITSPIGGPTVVTVELPCAS